MFEVTYSYQEAIAPGKYAEEVKTMTKKVGTIDDDTSLDAVASKIMAQLARRNIMVTDIEIYEYTKKKLSYRETEDGIVIKNKKFKFDDGPLVVGTTLSAVPTDPDYSECDEPEVYAIESDHRQALPAPSTSTAGPRRTKPIRKEVYEPISGVANYMTPGKLYGIYNEEQVLPPGMQTIDPKLSAEERLAFIRRSMMMAKTVYEVENDRGQRVRLPPADFSAPVAGLRIEGEVLESPRDVGPRLSGNFIEENIPDIRSVRR